jgi:ABC-type multidrug transport system fused ATPase/permease subunit
MYNKRVCLGGNYMNKSFVELNDNQGIVSDDNGNVKIISKSGQGVTLTEILDKENRIEKIENDILQAKNNISKIKRDNVFATISFINYIICQLMIFFLLNPVVAPAVVTVLMLSLLAVFEIGTELTIGSSKKRYRNLLENENMLQNLKSMKEVLEKSLSIAKEESKYAVNYSTDNELNYSGYVVLPDPQIELSSHQNEEDESLKKENHVKVLKLTK